MIKISIVIPTLCRPDTLRHCLATVVSEWRGDKDQSSIEYEFKDFQGQTRRASGFDYTQKLFAGMPVAVFYDRDNPKRQIPACATYHEIVT